MIRHKNLINYLSCIQINRRYHESKEKCMNHDTLDNDCINKVWKNACDIPNFDFTGCSPLGIFCIETLDTFEYYILISVFIFVLLFLTQMIPHHIP